MLDRVHCEFLVIIDTRYIKIKDSILPFMQIYSDIKQL